jgi:hypothetical protein
MKWLSSGPGGSKRSKPLLAANIGAATPLIIKAFAEGLRPVQSILPRDASAYFSSESAPREDAKKAIGRAVKKERG